MLHIGGRYLEDVRMISSDKALRELLHIKKVPTEKFKDGVEHRFELEFNVEGKTGFIDFLYFDKIKEGWVIIDFKTGSESTDKNKQYQEQLDFYKAVMEDLGYRIVDTQLLWLYKEYSMAYKHD